MPPTSQFPCPGLAEPLRKASTYPLEAFDEAMETRTALDDNRYTYGEFREYYGAENAPAFWWNAYHDSERWHGTRS